MSVKMNIFTRKWLFQLSRYTSTKHFSNFSKHHLLNTCSSTQKLIIRCSITRPKELDLLRKKVKEREQESGSYKQSSSSEENIGLYGYFLLVEKIAFSHF